MKNNIESLCDAELINEKKVNVNDAIALKQLKAGDCVYLYGTIYTARDKVHNKIFNIIKDGDKVPFALNGAVIYYTGPCVDNERKISAAGPTTSCRMDAYAPALYDNGVIATIGKGDRSEEVYKAITRNEAVYFSAIGGAGALYAKSVTKCEDVCFIDLGAEAVRKLTVENFPVIVAIDSEGKSIYT